MTLFNTNLISKADLCFCVQKMNLTNLGPILVRIVLYGFHYSPLWPVRGFVPTKMSAKGLCIIYSKNYSELQTFTDTCTVEPALLLTGWMTFSFSTFVFTTIAPWCVILAAAIFWKAFCSHSPVGNYFYIYPRSVYTVRFFVWLIKSKSAWSAPSSYDRAP